MRHVRVGTKAERDGLRREMLQLGCTAETVAREMSRRWGFRPREAYRHAYGWSQDEVAGRFTSVAAELQACREDAHGSAPSPATAVVAIGGTRIGEYERWPRGGRRPSVYALVVLAEVMATSVDRLLDYEDHRRLPDVDRTLLAALCRTHHIPAVSANRAALRALDRSTA